MVKKAQDKKEPLLVTEYTCTKHNKPFYVRRGKSMGVCEDCIRAPYAAFIGSPHALSWQIIQDTYAFIPKASPVLVWCNFHGPVVATLADPEIWTQYPEPDEPVRLEPVLWSPIPRPDAT